MKKSILNPAVACVMLFTLTYCSKTPEKPVKNIPYSNVTADTIKTNAYALKDTITLAEDSLALKVKDYITSQYLKPEDLKVIEPSERKFNLYQIDLNNDGKNELFINFFTPYFCGSGGCSLVLLNSDLKLINKFTVTRTPITIDSKTKNGWKVLWIQDGSIWKTLTNNNGKYPSNPSLADPTKDVPETNATELFGSKTTKAYSF